MTTMDLTLEQIANAALADSLGLVATSPDPYLQSREREERMAFVDLIVALPGLTSFSDAILDAVTEMVCDALDDGLDALEALLNERLADAGLPAVRIEHRT